MKKVYYSEEQINQMIDELIDSIRSSGERFTQVVGIKNGGIPVSTRIAKALGVAHTTVRISHYVGDQIRHTPLIDMEDRHTLGHILVVDDLVDTGATINTFHHHFGNGMVAVLFWNTDAEPRPDFYVKEKPNAWVVFPWEV